MKTTFAIALISASAFATDLPNDEARFLDWCAKHGKQYGTAVELAERKAAWFKADAEIIKNSLENPGARFAHNQYSDSYESEWAARMGAIPPIDGGVRRLEAEESGPRVLFNEQLDINWANANNPKGAKMVGDVKNQGQCGSCWAFNATLQQESMDCIHHNRPYVRHSEQEMVDCTQGSCGGGWMTYVFEWSRINGSSSNADYPYKAADGTCNPSPTKVSKVANYGYISSSVTAMEDYLQASGPISVAVSSGNSVWYNYAGGIVSSCPTTIDHGVVIVGAGADESTTWEEVVVPGPEVCQPANNRDIRKQSCRGGAYYKADTQECCTQSTTTELQPVTSYTPYWIIQNSWGAGWGEGGFMRILRTNDSTGVCAINTYPMHVSTLSEF